MNFNIKISNIAFLGLLAVLFLLAWCLEWNYFNPDVAWLIQATQKSIHGGTYENDFFSPNPPMIMYLYLPVAIMVDQLKLDVMLIFHAYVFLLAAMVLGFCSYFLSLHHFSKDIVTQQALLVIFAIIFLVVPMNELGQRDTLMFLLGMPYFLIVANRLDGHEINTLMAALAGVLAGMAFGIKPHFLVIPLFVECYYLFRVRSFFRCFRPEIIAMASVLIIYSGLVLFLHRDFIFIVVPYVIQNYYSALGVSWIDLLVQKQMQYAYIAISIYLLRLVIWKKQSIIDVFFFVLLGCMISYATQRTMISPYHLIPVFSAAVLLCVFLYVDIAKKVVGFYSSRFSRLFVAKSTILLLLALMIFFYPVHVIYARDFETLTTLERDAPKQSMIEFVRQRTVPRIHILSISPVYGSILTTTTNVVLTNRFDCLWMLLSFYRAMQALPSAQFAHYMNTSHQVHIFTSMLSAELHDKKPNYIMIDVHFDYFLKYFLYNHSFHSEWQHYRQDVTLQRDGSDPVVVYRRV